jgi:hypothetical protein
MEYRAREAESHASDAASGELASGTRRYRAEVPGREVSE